MTVKELFTTVGFDAIVKARNILWAVEIRFFTRSSIDSLNFAD